MRSTTSPSTIWVGADQLEESTSDSSLSLPEPVGMWLRWRFRLPRHSSAADQFLADSLEKNLGIRIFQIPPPYNLVSLKFLTRKREGVQIYMEAFIYILLGIVMVLICWPCLVQFLSGFLVRNMVEEPVEIKEKLNFDYTKNSPVALVLIWSCPAVGFGVNCNENVTVLKNKGSWLIPVNHKLQVKSVDFLSANCETFASSSHPSMLKFKSEPIRLLLTSLKIVPLVAGYISESQTMNLKIRGLYCRRCSHCLLKSHT
ncbi:putative Adipose-regulatory protein [Tripterygium wilfordii]|uniref:Putative Adipose-regulatory protein n=1 Tax=Tripterygium wilfordii TaxID=458696 RepID=A0A7J7CQ83_TRIWF|nr:putative Adipose-regulatory protein [Tripterygium wilfordii]